MGGRLSTAARHLATNLLAIAAGFHTLLHDLGFLPLARRRAVATGVGARLMGIFRHRAAASHQCGCQRAECLAVDCRLMRFGVMIGVRITLLGFAEAMMCRLVADLGALAHDLDVLIVLVLCEFRTSGTAPQSDLAARTLWSSSTRLCSCPGSSSLTCRTQQSSQSLL